MVDHSDDIGGVRETRDALVPRKMHAPAVLRSPLRPQFTLLVWLTHRLIGSRASLVLIGVIAVGLLGLYLAKGPIALAGLGPRVTQALNEKVGPAYAFKLGSLSVTTHGLGPTLAIDNLTLTSREGATILSAPHAEISVDLFSLIYGKVVPTRLEIFGIEVRLALLPDGSLAVSAGNGKQQNLLVSSLTAAMETPGASAPAVPELPPLAGAARPRSLAMKRIAAALRLLIDIATRPTGPLAKIDRVAISQGRFVIEDELNNETKLYDGLQLSLAKTGGGTNFDLSAQGPNGPWSVSARAAGKPGAARRLDFNFKNISVDEISLVSGARDVGADFDMPVSSHLTVAIDSKSQLTNASGSVHFDPGYLRFDDPNDEPRLIDSIDTAFHWDGAARQIVIDNAQVRTGETEFALRGAITPPVREGDDWLIGLTNSRRGVYGVERPGEDRIFFDHIDFQGRLALDAKIFHIDRLAFSGPNNGFAMAGAVDWKNGPHMSIGASLSPTPAKVVVRLWPSFMAADIRDWFLEHVKGGIITRGTLRMNFDAAMIDHMHHQYPPPDRALAIDFAVSNGSLTFLKGVPPIEGVEGSGHITGRTSTFTATTGHMQVGSDGVLTLSEGGFHIAHAEIRPTPAELSGHVTGDVRAVGTLLGLDALKPFVSLPVDTNRISGQIDGQLGILLRLGPGADPKRDFKLSVDSTTTQFAAEKLLGNQDLRDATLHVTVDNNGLHAWGKGHCLGGLADIDVSRPVGGAYGKAVVSLEMDDAARAKQGLVAVPGVSGPIGMRVTAPLGAPSPIKAQIDLDLTRAEIDGLGITKAAGRPGKASFELSVDDNHTTTLDQLVVDAGGASIKGSVKIGAPDDPSQFSAHLTQVKLSPGDDAKVDLSKTADTLKVIIHAASFDGRPFLKTLTLTHAEDAAADGDTPHKPKGKQPARPSAKTPDFDMDIAMKAESLVGFNKVAMTNVDLHLVKNGATLKQFALTARMGRQATIVGHLDHADSPAPQLDLTTDNAGGLLAFVDLYKHMKGGVLNVAMRLGNDAMAGSLVVKNFVLADEPALRRLVAEGVPRSTRTGEPAFDPDAVSFRKLQVNFQRAEGRLDISDGVIYGSQIGVTANGWLDFAASRVDLQGTFVPAYDVNNFFTQIPFFGLLAGGSHEGLFAINYHIVGSPRQPTLNINPFSIAPGILRKIFGSIDLTNPDSESETPAPPGQEGR
ncbi:MAG: AsmA-like C-terminal domain-containing protein [Methylovirgula sp.]